MVFIRLGVLLSLLTGCGITYYSKIASHQISIMWNAEKISKALENPKLDPKIKRKLLLIQEVKAFSQNELGLKKSDNYSKYSQLKDKYVSYVVNATPKYSLKPHKWKYPIVGSLTYKGFPNKEDAIEEANRLKKENLDTYVRGVTAYSTLGWFNDPILSSMMNYSDEQLVELIIHESTHEFLYIKSNAEFNEQLASFFGRVGTEIYYSKKDPSRIRRLKDIEQDEMLFSNFIGKAKKELHNKYKIIRKSKMNEEEKSLAKIKAIKELQNHFKSEVKPKLKILSYNSILKKDLNNARISLYGTYIENQDLFARLYKKLGSTPQAYLNHLKDWEDEEKPLERLKKELEN